MAITYIPLLTKIRPLYDLPREPDQRFPFYIAQVRDGETIGCPPLVAYNPMGKAHVGAHLDTLIALGVDNLAQAWIEVLPPTMTARLGDMRLGIAVVDDVAGGWTERSAYEMNERFPQTQAKATAGWLTTFVYASEPIELSQVAARVTATVARAAIIATRGVAHTIEQMVAQEALVYQYAMPPFAIDDDEFAYTSAVIGPYLAAVDYPTQVAVLLGDELARRNGFVPLGFAPYAGLAWAARGGLTHHGTSSR
ncbi:MAG: hypothetical protein FJ040_09055 [Chloroflexi bacterium]|nr:hypothetical protein [Chloroflexota bacterium]